MNVFDVIDFDVRLPIVDLVEMSHRFQDMALKFTPERFELNVYEKDVAPALIGKLLGVGIETAKPRWKLGRVVSFDVVPYRRRDPVVVVCPEMDLVDYYSAWNSLMNAGWVSVEKILIYDAAISKAIRSARDLSRDEIHFAICEMLHFRNQMMGGAR